MKILNNKTDTLTLGSFILSFVITLVATISAYHSLVEANKYQTKAIEENSNDIKIFKEKYIELPANVRHLRADIAKIESKMQYIIDHLIEGH